MKRSSPLRVEQLEDRCVPATDLLAQTTASLVVVAPATSYVIDPPLIDPNLPGSDPAPPPTNDGSLPFDPGLIPPIAPPFWF